MLLRLVIVIVLPTGIGFGQNVGRVVSYTISDGIGSNAADFAIQDKYGFIWISQLHHITRFDGYNFVTYAHRSNDSLYQLGPQGIGRLLVDKNKNLWVDNVGPHSNGYLLRYDYEKDGFIKYKPDIKAFVRSLELESDSVLWLGTPGQGIFKYNLRSLKKENFLNGSVADKLKYQSNYIFNIHLQGNKLLLFTLRGIWTFDTKSGLFQRPDLDPADTSFLYKEAIFQADFRKDNLFQVGHKYAILLDSALRVIKKFDLPEPYIKSPAFNVFEMDNEDVSSPENRTVLN